MEKEGEGAPSYLEEVFSKRVLGPYDIENPLGAGGVATVFRARHRETGNVVSLKLLLDLEDEQWQQRFLVEEAALKKVAGANHKNLTQILDSGVVSAEIWGERKDIPYIALRYEEGINLDGLFRRGIDSYAQLLRYGRQINEGLSELHAQDIVHRDIKPTNIIIRKADDEAVIIDFGCAMFQRGELANLTLGRELESVGTGLYMPFEHFAQAVDRSSDTHIDHTADFYALGMTILEGLVMDKSLLGQSRDNARLYNYKQNFPPVLRDGVLNTDFGDDTPEWLKILRRTSTFFQALLHPNSGMRFQRAKEVDRGLKTVSESVRSMEQELEQTRGFMLSNPIRPLMIPWVRQMARRLSLDEWAACCTIRLGNFVLATEPQYQQLLGDAKGPVSQDGDLIPRGYRLKENGPVTIGRNEENVIRMTGKGLSRRHAHIGQDPDGFLIVDLGSRNGTFIEGELLKPEQKAYVYSGNIVTFGTERRRFVCWSEELYRDILGDDDPNRTSIYQRGGILGSDSRRE